MSINTDPHIHRLVMCANVFIRKDGAYLMLKRSEKKRFSPGYFHTVGGKIDAEEDPFTGALREVREEAGITVKNMRLEAVTFEIMPEKTQENWLCFYFSADYESGEIIQTEEGELVLIHPEDIPKQKLIPSIRAIIRHILDPKDGTVFIRMSYDKAGNVVESETIINICERNIPTTPSANWQSF
ncbi:MAG: NUDIX domain-containing protein [Candidatus Sungbacteria bacterium]|uniref:NUDIX domain-containing protein n=1 Tax=Candidatus Sungiibacteriota bacterium TaxID=2750080 RepID=A0A932QY56_9BACT|nr:NUDIX domain-containing protein [Candidatus Sungbacteria bacterium]